MLEALIVVAGLGLLVALAGLPSGWAISGGLALLGISFVLGLSASAVYHVKLYRALRTELPRGWIWHPHREHAKLRGPQSGPVLAWFAVGVTAFAGCGTGVLVLLVGMWKAWLAVV